MVETDNQVGPIEIDLYGKYRDVKKYDAFAEAANLLEKGTSIVLTMQNDRLSHVLTAGEKLLIVPFDGMLERVKPGEVIFCPRRRKGQSGVKSGNYDINIVHSVHKRNKRSNPETNPFFLAVGGTVAPIGIALYVTGIATHIISGDSKETVRHRVEKTRWWPNTSSKLQVK